MVIIIMRLLLLALPVIALILWLRWRARRVAADGPMDGDVRALIRSLLILLAIGLAAAIGLYTLDDNQAPAGQIYVPPQVVDGELIPGHFIDPADQQNTDQKPAGGEDSGGEGN